MTATTPGSLKLFLGYAPGVGKAKVMVEEARRRKARGQDVVIAIITEEDRLFSEDFSQGLETIPPARFSYGGEEGLEIDLKAIVDRRPDLVLVDNLSHKNVPGAVHGRRWEDVEFLLREGISVLATMNVISLESLQDTILEITGIKVENWVPDRFFKLASEIELVDLSPKALINRVIRGDIVPKSEIPKALEGIYREVVLNALRELAMREIAHRVDEDLISFKKDQKIARPWQTSDRIVICISPTRSSLRLIRRGWRLAQRIHGDIVAVYVEEGKLSDNTQRILTDDIKLCERLGIPTVTLNGEVSEAIIKYAEDNNITQIILGHTDRTRVQEFLKGSLLLDLAKQLKTVDILVVATESPKR